MNIQTAIVRCIDELPLAPKTKLTYVQGLERFKDYLASEKIAATDSIERLTVDHFIYFSPWISKRYSKSTVRCFQAATQQLLKWLVISNYLEPTYKDTVRLSLSVHRAKSNHESKLPRFPQRDEVSRMLRAAHESTEPSPRRERTIALVEFLASSGCRISEVLQLCIKDLDMKNRSAIVVGKGNKERRVWFSTDAMNALKSYWVTRKSQAPGDPVFARHDKRVGKKTMRLTVQGADWIVNRIARVADIDHFTPHYFRHAFAIKALSETSNLALVQDMLGHSNPTSTRVYAKIYPEDLAAAHREIFK